LVDLFPGVAQNLFEMQQDTTHYFPKRNCADSGNVSFNRKKGIKNSKKNCAYTHVLQKLFVNSQAFSVNQLRIY
jgi:hypothetical protein